MLKQTAQIGQKTARTVTISTHPMFNDCQSIGEMKHKT